MLIGLAAGPGFVFLEAVFWVEEFFPDEACFVAVLVAFLDMVNDVLEIPGWFSLLVVDFEFEEAEADFIFGGVCSVEHEHERHVIGSSAIVERLGVAGPVVAPDVEFEVVIVVV